MRSILVCFVFSLFLVSCSTMDEKPNIDIMKQCLVDELGSSVKIIGYEHQDGVLKVIEGVWYYDAFFNAEVKFLSNTGGMFRVGDEYKLVSVSVQLMKTERGWNCQEFDWSASKLIKLNKDKSDNNSISGQRFKDELNYNLYENTNRENNQSSKSYIQNYNFEHLNLSEKVLSINELRGYSKNELRIMRNQIYAKHGYIFKSEDLRDYFKSQTWYNPRYNDVTNRLNSVEKENITIIKGLE